jgi:hypothetical protein
MFEGLHQLRYAILKPSPSLYSFRKGLISVEHLAQREDRTRKSKWSIVILEELLKQYQFRGSGRQNIGAECPSVSLPRIVGCKTVYS